MVPTETGKTGRHFPVGEKSGNFANTRKVWEFYPKYWENQKKGFWKIEKKKIYWKSQGNLSASNSENPANMVPYFRFKKEHKKNTGKVGNLPV